MKYELRLRYWLAVATAAVGFLLGMVTILWRDWIEILTDGGCIKGFAPYVPVCCGATKCCGCIIGGGPCGGGIIGCETRDTTRGLSGIWLMFVGSPSNSE